MEILTKFLAVGIGGAFGAAARYAMNLSPLQTYLKPFPLPTFVINVSGSFMIGFLLILLGERFQVNENLRLAVMVGFLGAFTTFSTFELEIWELIRESHYATALLYLLLSVVAGFIGVVAGLALARKML